MFSVLMCKLWGHKINRKRVWDDGISFRGRCHRCDAAMIRDFDNWRVYDPQMDFDINRKPHPRFEHNDSTRASA